MSERLSLPDAAWLLIEGRERPMHVGGLQLFRPPEGQASEWVAETVASLRTNDDIRSPFNRRLKRPYGIARGIYSWVEEEEVELDYHFRHLALPEPGRIRELLATVSQLHSTLLDRHRPLWQSYLIEGIEDGRVALYTKAHHSMMDGVAAMRQLMRSFSADPDDRDLPPPWTTPRERRVRPDDEGGGGAMSAVSDLLRLAGGGVTSSITVTRALTSQLIRAQTHAEEVVPFQAPASMLNVRLTSSRRFVAQSYGLERIKAVAKELDATVNDVMLALCSGALRTYLIDQGALPSKPLIALVPVSFRTQDGSETGNSISLVPANLATHLDDPVERLQLIRSSMNAIKDRLRDMTPMELINYGIAMTAPLILGQLTGLAGRLPRPDFNVVISNVPGPDHPLYWNGAEMTGLYPASLLNEGYALNITMTSYNGSMDIGFTADRRALPSVQRLIDHVEDSLCELERVAGTG